MFRDKIKHLVSPLSSITMCSHLGFYFTSYTANSMKVAIENKATKLKLIFNTFLELVAAHAQLTTML